MVIKRNTYTIALIIFSFSFSFSSQSPELNTNKPKEITIGLMGDVMLGRGVNQALNNYGYDYPWSDIAPILRSNSINIANLETTLTNSTRAVPKVFNFKATPDKVIALKRANITAVNLANNHSLDFNTEGLIDTLQALDYAQIQHTGAGLTLYQAQKPAIITKNNITIALLGFTDNMPEWQATQTKPGVNVIDTRNPQPAISLIKKIRPHVDLIIVSLHWGPNMRQYPSPQFQKFAHALIDAGADIIHGHSAHIFQPIEIYKSPARRSTKGEVGKVILYDTGDFINDYAVDPLLRNDQSFLFNITAQKDTNQTILTKLTLIPVIINNNKVSRATPKQAKELIAKIQALSKPFNTNIPLYFAKSFVKQAHN